MWEAIRTVRSLRRRAPPLRKAPRIHPLPLSYAQQRLWFIQQLEPENTAYNEHLAYYLYGALDYVALARSLEEILRRHEVLRSRFASNNGQPFQTVASKMPLDLPLIDRRNIPEEALNEDIRSLIVDEVRRPFDLANDPALRSLLIRTGENSHVLVLVLHHITTDGWSMGILLRELAVLYEAFSTGKRPELPALPVQYADYAVWQRRFLRNEVLQTLLDYWKQRLHDAPGTLELPVDRQVSNAQASRGAQYNFEVSSSCNDRIKELSQREGVSLFAILLAVFKSVLQRYTGQTDILVGTPVADRDRVETRELIGFFVNTLVLRTCLSDDPTLLELISRIHREVASAYAHKDLPFERLIEELKPVRDSAHTTPLIRVMFDLQNFPHPHFNLPGLQAAPVEVDPGTTKFDLSLSMVNTAQGLKGTLRYSTDLFDEATIARLANSILTILERGVIDLETHISRLPLLNEDEHSKLVGGWNDNQTDYPANKTVHELFEDQTKKAPDATAVVFEAEQLSYAQLNRRANRIANRLRRFGVEPGTLVGVCMVRSLDMIVVLLGILKVGGAYVPLDPSYPKERLKFMLEDAAPLVLLTQQRLLDELPDYGAQVICLDCDQEITEDESEEDLPNGAGAESLAYVMYTSGSTGNPKGICVPHRAINRLVLNTDYINLGPQDKIAQASNSSFDAATFEIWGALLNGGQLIGFSQDVVLSPQEFAAKIRDCDITTLFLTTALFNQMAREAPWAFGSLRNLLFGGEAVEPRWVAHVLRNGPPQRLLHVYGPTENTTFTSFYPVHEVPENASTIPIGRPIANTRMYVLDQHAQIVPVGVPGELHIAGDGLAHGYLNLPELTAERFVPDPFSPRSRERMYRTGDLARVLPGGNIEFLGRIDQQVKIRGYRIEPSEIEAALSQHAAVRESAVVPQDDVLSGKRLVAYVVPKQDSKQVTIAGLRNYLNEKLPKYMLPSTFTILDELPLTPNGKVDRDALPSLDENQVGLEGEQAVPRTDVEQEIAAVWQEVLGVGKVGIHDNFFDLGGHSLLLARVQSKLNQVIGDLSMVELFEYPTISSLALRLTQKDQNLSSAGEPGRDRAEKQRDALSQQRKLAQQRRKRR